MNNDDSGKTDVEMLMALAWSSDELKRQQTSLTRTINAFVKHKGELSKFSSFEELDAIYHAIRTLHGFKQKVCHAKEKKARAEKAEKRRREVVESKLKTVVVEYFESLPLYDQAVLCCSYLNKRTLEYGIWNMEYGIPVSMTCQKLMIFGLPLGVT